MPARHGLDDGKRIASITVEDGWLQTVRLGNILPLEEPA